ncbi:MAG: hypothetical protein JWO77_1204, partial [Ilumatobacteraceae bacterium]|nr:hypothetical protein [Ilumatobacteraceae bacterium]
PAPSLPQRPAAAAPSAWDAAATPQPWVDPSAAPAPGEPGQATGTENPSSGWGAPGEAR